MKLQLSRRDFSLAAANIVAGSSLFGLGGAFAQGQKQVSLGTFGSIDAQNYIGAKGLAAKTFGPTSRPSS
jgi:taurine transport system substrate-binding protein